MAVRVHLVEFVGKSGIFPTQDLSVEPVPTGRCDSGIWCHSFPEEKSMSLLSEGESASVGRAAASVEVGSGELPNVAVLAPLFSALGIMPKSFNTSS